jgi:hypothetical protein
VRPHHVDPSSAIREATARALAGDRHRVAPLELGHGAIANEADARRLCRLSRISTPSAQTYYDAEPALVELNDPLGGYEVDHTAKSIRSELRAIPQPLGRRLRHA